LPEQSCPHPPLRELQEGAKGDYDSPGSRYSIMTRRDEAAAWTPDENARALGDSVPDALRYDGHGDDPHEVAGIMRAAMPSGVRVLDVGCGTGSLALIVNAGKENRVLGLEPDASRADVARSRGLPTITGTLDDAFIAAHGRFDVIIFADVLEHLPSPAQALQAAVRGLDAGGLLLISVPNVGHWSIRANLLMGRFDYEEFGLMDSTHLRWFTEKSLRAFVQRSGLEILSLCAAAGLTLPVYERSVLRHLPFRARSVAVRLGTRLLPRLFGSQFVVVARKPMTAGGA
jgi:methionine biosynthesis protein MetW